METKDKLMYIVNFLYSILEKEELSNYDMTEEEADNIVNYTKDIREALTKPTILVPVEAYDYIATTKYILEKYKIKDLDELDDCLKVFNDLKHCLYVSGTQTGNGFPNLEICVKKPGTENVYIPFYTTKTYEDFVLYQEVFKEK